MQANDPAAILIEAAEALEAQAAVMRARAQAMRTPSDPVADKAAELQSRYPDGLTPKEVAHECRVTISTVRRWADRERLVPVKLGGRYYFPAASVAKCLVLPSLDD